MNGKQRHRIRVGAFALMMLGVLAPGCQSQMTIGAATSSHSWMHLGEENVPGLTHGAVESITLYKGSPSGMRVLIWCDSSKGSSSTSGAVFVSGHFLLADGGKLSYRCDAKNGRQATVMIADETFQTEQGALFLVATSRGKPVVKQLALSAGELPEDTTQVRQMADEHSVIKEFFKQHAENPTEQRSATPAEKPADDESQEKSC